MSTHSESVVSRAIEIARNQGEKIRFHHPDIQADFLAEIHFAVIRELLRRHPDLYDPRTHMDRDHTRLSHGDRWVVVNCKMEPPFHYTAFPVIRRGVRYDPDEMGEFISRLVEVYANEISRRQAESRADGYILCPHDLVRFVVFKDSQRYEEVVACHISYGLLDVGMAACLDVNRW